MYRQSSMVVSNATSTMPSCNQLTMSSREIANLTGKLHAHVIRDINSMLNDLLKDDPNLDDEIKQNVTFEYDSREYVSNVWLGRKYIECLLTGYSSSLRMKVIKRLHELEDSVFQLPKTLPEALRAYADECEKNLKLESKIQEDAPKVAFVDNYVTSRNSKSLRETAKILKMSERALIDALIRDRFLYRLSGNLLPYSRPSIKPYFTVKTGSAENGHAYSQTRITAKGISWIASRYASELMVN
ncbi:phage antirepressor KilAC domain-containing protein [Gilliamella sp. BG6]|uniref:phage antirepressor KilAC domain-containing protein n=1 Tax=unclassified Gilliamella TaxID=2685620 RepID=UPI0039877F7B|nr:phage antirepressor KilAC domain-containing protein [Gilliamella sp.]